VKETYPKIKQQFEEHTQPANFQSKNVISIVAKQWQDVPDNEKEEWKRRAKEMSDQVDEEDDDDADEDDDASENVADVVNRLTTPVQQGVVPPTVVHHNEEVHVQHEEVVGDSEYYKDAPEMPV